MNYKKMKWLLIPLVGMFVLWWIASVWIYTRNPKDHMEIIEAALSTGSGYNYIKPQILFAMIFVVTLFQLMPELGLQQVIKTGRTRWILDRVRYTFISAMYFAAIFIAVETVFGVIRIEFTFLIKLNYFWCMLLGWISLTFIYLFMGCIYLMFSVLLSAGLVALGVSFLVSLIFMALSMYSFVPTVYLVMDVMQWPAMKEMGMRGMDIMFVVKPLIYNAIAMVAMIIVSVQVFKRKDLLDSSLQLI